MVMAKGIANGFPLSAIVSRKELMDKQPAGSQGGTYGGNANEGVLENVEERSKEIFGLLNELKADPKIGETIAEVRGLGLMVGVRIFPLLPFPSPYLHLPFRRPLCLPFPPFVSSLSLHYGVSSRPY
jgi:acetylornithine/succinyldiaminopimelate/putrescine aminotransferase